MNKTQQYRDLLIEIEKKEASIKNSVGFISLEEKIDDLTQKKNDLLLPLNDMVQKSLDLYKEIVESEQIDENIGSFKYRVSSEVDTASLYSVVGDVDKFVSMVSVTQKALKDYAKENPDLKKPLLNCIKETGKTISGINIL